jgi:hypothetical protein
MNTLQLECVLNADPVTRHVRVYAADQLPQQRLTQFPRGLIVNTEPSTMRGRHWVAIWLDSAKHGEFFDSFGKPPEYYHRQFRIFLQKNNACANYNDRVLQHADSDTCGLFALFYIAMKSMGSSLRDIQSYFCSDTRVNEAIVYQFALTYFKHCIV